MQTINRRCEDKLTVERSRFFALVFPATTLEQVKEVVDARRRKHRKARHHCWACRVRGPGGEIVEQARDDGEVGRPGTVMLELLRRHDLEGGIVVSRIFGGVKLGPGGVSRAFRAAAEATLAKLQPSDHATRL
jgi:putative IMPACT (imprinted ancient) family translation regulator